MSKIEFTRMIVVMQDLVYEPLIEGYLKDLKNHFNEDQTTEIEDYIFHLSDDTLLMTIEEFYNHIQTKKSL